MWSICNRLRTCLLSALYEARHLILDSAVAIKVLLATHDEESQQRFLREARLASKASHPNVVSLSDFGVLPSGQLYLCMPSFLRQR
ncbi:MAG TPA: protein kinase [Pseudomonadota bacterium]|nr:protein kinase [Pseudomonadota bacterium]